MNVNSNRFPNWYVLYGAEKIAKLSPELRRFVDEDAEFPMFSINTSVERLTLNGIVIKAADARPILRLGAYARVGYLRADLSVHDPARMAVPLVMAPGGQVGKFEYSLIWFPIEEASGLAK